MLHMQKKALGVGCVYQVCSSASHDFFPVSLCIKHVFSISLNLGEGVFSHGLRAECGDQIVFLPIYCERLALLFKNCVFGLHSNIFHSYQF